MAFELSQDQLHHRLDINHEQVDENINEEEEKDEDDDVEELDND
jgi:hypothetical protein